MIYIQTLNYKLDVTKTKFSYPKNLMKDYEKFICREFIKRVKKHIKKQDLNWPPLSTEYYQYKLSNNLSLNTWEATSLLKKTLGLLKKGDTYIIGWGNSRRHKGVKVSDISRYLEYGTIKIPPRPLFRTVLKSIIKDLPTLEVKFFSRYVGSKGGN